MAHATSAGRAPHVAAGAVVAMLVAMGAGIALGVAAGSVIRPLDHLVLIAAFLAYGLTGAVVAARRPANAVGWIFLATGLVASGGVLATEYAHFAYVGGAALPGAGVAAWIASWFWYPILLFALFLPLLLFPDGRPPSPRWRPVVWVAVGLTVFMSAHSALAEQLTVGEGGRFTVPNPVGVPGLPPVEDSASAMAIVNVVSLFLLAATIAGLVVRYRRSRADERAQLKWFASAGALALCAILTIEVLAALGIPVPDPVGNVAFGAVVALIPLTMGVAVLKYRLYDIDRILSRTVTYAGLTGVLAAVYAGGVLLSAPVFAPFGASGDLAVAGATLAAAAVFSPARRRIQSAVDRRFNRARYDAARAVDGFRAHLRDEVDLDQLTAGLLEVVDETVQPATAALWLRQSPGQLPTRVADRT